MYQALYRKWRPRTFDDVVGQEYVTETLKNQVKTGRLSHAYLFIGSRGTGKTTCAKILARAVNCEHPINGNPCNQCRSCLGIEDGSIMDVVELDAASNNGVDNVRALRDEAVFSPALVKKRVYIIDEVHMLSLSAFNALLKILEEPPEHLMFILATTELNKIPATILSRCQRHSFRRIDSELIARRIMYISQQENMKLDENAATLLARLADGSMRDGLSLLDQCSGAEQITTQSILTAMGLAGNMRITELLSSVTDGDAGAALKLFASLWKDGKDPSSLLIELNSLLRDILVIKVSPHGGADLLSGGYDMATLKMFADKLSDAQIISHMDTIASRLALLRDGREPRTSAELCIVSMCEPYLEGALSPVDKITRPQAAYAPPRSAQAHAAPTAAASPTTPQKTEDTAVETPPWDEPSASARCDAPVHADCGAGDVSNEPDVAAVPSSAPVAEDPPQTAQSPTVSDPDNWSLILNEILRSAPPFVCALFEGTSCQITDSGITVLVADSFKQSMLNSAENKDAIKAAVLKVMGVSLPLTVVIGDGFRSETAADSGRLDDLMRFGNVKFE